MSEARNENRGVMKELPEINLEVTEALMILLYYLLLLPILLKVCTLIFSTDLGVSRFPPHLRLSKAGQSFSFSSFLNHNDISSLSFCQCPIISSQTPA